MACEEPERSCDMCGGRSCKQHIESCEVRAQAHTKKLCPDAFLNGLCDSARFSCLLRCCEANAVTKILVVLSAHDNKILLMLQEMIV